MALGIESALIADAEAAAVEGSAVGSHLVMTAVLCEGAVAADVVVVADVDEATGEVVAAQLLHGVAAVFAGGGTVDDEVTHGFCRHVEASFYTGEEVLLGGDRGAANGHGILFCCHS